MKTSKVLSLLSSIFCNTGISHVIQMICSNMEDVFFSAFLFLITVLPVHLYLYFTGLGKSCHCLPVNRVSTRTVVAVHISNYYVAFLYFSAN